MLLSRIDDEQFGDSTEELQTLTRTSYGLDLREQIRANWVVILLLTILFGTFTACTLVPVRIIIVKASCCMLPHDLCEVVRPCSFPHLACK